MRVPASRALRVGPGDEVIIQARLPTPAKLGRLFVFASDGGPYSPYVNDIDVPFDKPKMLMPLSMRLTQQSPKREMRFISSIDGRIRVMQEIDTVDDHLAKIRLQRNICPNLSWRMWVTRKLTGLLPW